MTKIFNSEFGEIKLRNCMIDVDGTNLVDGTSIYVDGKHIIDVQEYLNLDEMSVKKCIAFIELYL